MLKVAAGVALSALLLAASVAHAAATLTYPSNGQTVALDKNGDFTFQWTLPPGEAMPDVWVGATPTYDPDTLDPFHGECGSAQTDTACPTETPLSAGTHYAFMFTTDTDNVQRFYSPVTSFTVPPKLALGCGPVAPGCVAAKGFQRIYVPHPPIGLPNSTLEMNAWFNAPDDSAANFTFILKRGRKVLARIHDVQRSSDLLVDSGFLLHHSDIRWGSHHKRWHAPPGGTKLTCICTVTAEGLTITRNETVKVPPA